MLPLDEPYLLLAGVGHRETSWHGAHVAIKLLAEEADYRTSIVEMTWSEDAEVPVQVHDAADVALYVLAGRLTVALGEDVLHAESGDLVMRPAGCRMAGRCRRAGRDCSSATARVGSSARCSRERSLFT